MAEIISDGTRSVTSDDTSARDYSRMGWGGYGHVPDWPERTAERVRAEMFADSRDHGEQVRDLLAATAKAELATEKIGAAQILAIQKGATDTTSEVQRNATLLGIQALVTDLRNRTIDGFGQSRSDAIMFANQARTDAIQFNAATNLAIEKTAAAGVLLATQNEAKLSRELAECCCELKELIRAENGATRDLINLNTQQDLRDRLSTANAALLSLKAQVII